jgi:hypothetical protein
MIHPFDDPAVIAGQVRSRTTPTHLKHAATSSGCMFATSSYRCCLYVSVGEERDGLIVSIGCSVFRPLILLFDFRFVDCLCFFYFFLLSRFARFWSTRLLRRLQGTIAMEIIKKSAGRPLDAIFVCCGGGGMLSGIAAFVKSIRPEVLVIGVEADDAAGMTESLRAGHVVSLEHVGLFADGAAVRTTGAETFRVANKLVDGMVGLLLMAQLAPFGAIHKTVIVVS